MKYYQRLYRTAFFLVAFSLLCSSPHAQSTIPNVQTPQVFLNNPSAFLSDWKSRASTALVTVISTAPSPIPSKIWVEFILNGSRVAYSQPAKLPVTMIAPGTNVFNGETLVPLQTVHFESGVDQNSQRAGRIPDGQVCLIVHVQELDSKTGAPTGREAKNSPGTGCSLILSYSPPSLILPDNQTILCKLGYNNVIGKEDGRPITLFQWTPIVPAPQSPVTYHFAIYEVFPGQAPIAALRGARAVFQRDLLNMTNMIWPTEYFLPEAGKTYVWSVRALDESGNPFVVTNDGWAVPYTFSIAPKCDQSGDGGDPLKDLILSSQVLDFGSVRVGTTSDARPVTITNNGRGTLNLLLPAVSGAGSYEGFSISQQPEVLVLSPGASSTFSLVFKPTTIGSADGSVKIATDAGPITIQLKGQGIDTKSPTIRITSPAGGEMIAPGSKFQIKFDASDNDALSNYVATLSTDGGTSFPTTISPPDNGATAPPSLLWNVPSDLQTSQGVIQIRATDKMGNAVKALSGPFSVGSGGGGGGAGGSIGSTDVRPKNTNLTDVYLRPDPSAFTFIPLAVQVLTPTGTPRGIPPTRGATPPGTTGNGQGEIAPGPPIFALGDGSVDIPPDLIEPSKAPGSGGGIKISAADGGGVNTNEVRYAVQYQETDFDFFTPGKGPFNYADAGGSAVNAMLFCPEENNFLDATSFLNPPPPPSPAEQGSPGSSDLSPSKLTIGSLTGGSPITAYYNPKEITIDKPVPWQKHRNSEGDRPSTEFTAGEGEALDVELMFDMFEDQKSVKPDLQHVLRWLGVEDGKFSRVKVKFYWDRSSSTDMTLAGLSMKYTMFLPDGTPTRAKVTVVLRGLDKSHRLFRSSEKSSGGAGGSGNESIFFNTNIGPQTLQILQSNQSVKDPILHDPVFSDRERALRGALVQDLPAMSKVKFSRDQLKGTTKTQGDFNLAHRFTVEIDGVMVGGIHTVEGLEHEHEVVEYQDGDDMYTHLRPGRQKPGKITLTKDWSGTKEFYDWSRSTASDKTKRRNVSIIVQDDAGEARRYNLFDCFPMSYKPPPAGAKTSAHATESIEFTYERMDVQPVIWHFAGEMKSMKGTMSQPAQQMTLLVPTTIGGEKAELMLIGLLMPPTSAAPNTGSTESRNDVNADLSGWKWEAYFANKAGIDWGDFGDNSGQVDETQSGRSYVSGNFELDLDGVKAGLVQKLEGGDVQGDGDQGGQIGIQVVPVSGSIYKWVKASFDKSTGARKSGELHAADFKRDSKSSREFKDALVTEIGFPGCDGSSKDPGFLNLKFAPEIIRYKKGSGNADVSKFAIDGKIQKKWLPANFRLKIDGMDDASSRVNKIEALVVKQSVATDNIGEARDYQKEPGHIDFPNLSVSIPSQYAKDFYDWHEDFAVNGNTGKPSYKHGSLEYLNAEGEVLIHFDLDLFPQSILPPKPGQGSSAVITLGTSPGAPTADKRSFTAGKYGIELDGIMAGLVQSVDGGPSTGNAGTEGMAPEHIAKKHIGGVKYEDITLTFTDGMSKGMYDWIKNSFSSKHSRKDGAIVSANYDFKELTRLNFYHGLITEVGMPALDAASKDAAKMTVTFSPETADLMKIDSPKTLPSDDAKQKNWMPANFRLKLDGFEEAASHVNKIEAISIKQKMDAPGSGMTNGIDPSDCSQVLKSILGSDEYFTKLIGSLYQTYLRRPAEPNGLNTYLNILKAGGRSEQVLIGIISSQEYFTTQCGATNAGYVSEIYQDLLGRTADGGSAALVDGLNNATQSRVQIVTQLILSPEYRTRQIRYYYGTYLGRMPNSAEVAEWLGVLNGGASIDQLKASLLGSPEYRMKNPSGDCATHLYKTLLGRSPTKSEGSKAAGMKMSSSATKLVFTVPQQYAHDFDVVAGKKLEGINKGGSLAYYNGDGKELLTLNFATAGLFRRSAPASENNADAISKVTFEMYIENIEAKFAD
ncbi:MAG: phage tail protein [Bacteroidota bacterium]|nr:phage tail protein [Bacteroidota bacterium]